MQETHARVRVAFLAEKGLIGCTELFCYHGKNGLSNRANPTRRPSVLVDQALALPLVYRQFRCQPASRATIALDLYPRNAAIQVKGFLIKVNKALLVSANKVAEFQETPLSSCHCLYCSGPISPVKGLPGLNR